MKNTALIFTGLSLIGLVAAFFLYSTTEINPFQLFILAIVSISGFGIGLSNLILRSKHKATKWVRFGSIVLFIFTNLIFIFPNLYNMLWNTVLFLHIALIGYALYQLIPPTKSLVFSISRVLIAITTLLFSTVILFKIANPIFYSAVNYSLILLSVLVAFLFFFARFFTKNDQTTNG